MKLRFSWLWSFSAFLVLAVVSIWREVPVSLPPRPEDPGTYTPSLVPESAAVLPFDDVLVASPYAISDKKTPSERPEAVRREPDGSLACELGAATNHLGGLDGRGLARALAAELSRAKVFSKVRYVEGLSGLEDESVLIRGKVLAAVLRVKRDKTREYELALELTAERSYAPGRSENEPFWRRSLRQEAKGKGLPTAYEAGELVGKLYGELGQELGEAVRR